MAIIGEPELRKKVSEVGGILPVAVAAGMKPSTVAKKLRGWSVLYPEERQKILNAIDQLRHENTEPGIKTNGVKK
jgi:hypothetical protein